MIKGEERLFAAVTLLDGRLQVFFLKYMGTDEYGLKMNGILPDLGIMGNNDELPEIEIVDDENTYKIMKVDDANHWVWLEQKG